MNFQKSHFDQTHKIDRTPWINIIIIKYLYFIILICVSQNISYGVELRCGYTLSKIKSALSNLRWKTFGKVPLHYLGRYYFVVPVQSRKSSACDSNACIGGDVYFVTNKREFETVATWKVAFSIFHVPEINEWFIGLTYRSGNVNHWKIIAAVCKLLGYSDSDIANGIVPKKVVEVVRGYITHEQNHSFVVSSLSGNAMYYRDPSTGQEQPAESMLLVWQKFKDILDIDLDRSDESRSYESERRPRTWRDF